MKNVVDTATDRPGEFPISVRTRTHVQHADVGADDGSTDSAPGPHDYFDAALAACKTLTATWYARKNDIDLERVEAHVERDTSEERKGTYRLKVRLAYHGNMTDEQRVKLHDAVSRCPIHKLMTTTDVVIETAPLVDRPVGP